MAQPSKEDEPVLFGVHTFRPFLLEYTMMAELLEVERRRIPGVYVMPSAASSLVWFGILVIRSGLYSGGVFKFILIASDSHPHSGMVPDIVFKPPVFHPLVDMVTGQMGISVRFQKWKPQSNSIAELLEFVKDSFYQMYADWSVNPEASSIYANSKGTYAQRAAESVQYCCSRLFDSLLASRAVRTTSGEIDEDVDPHAFPSTLIDGMLLEEEKQKMLSSGTAGSVSVSPTPNGDHEKQASPSCGSSSSDHSVATFTEEDFNDKRPVRGFSWVKPGTAIPFSKDTDKS